ncbi:MAG: MFS transporter [Anaerolineae bacterium]|nr:MFS transporter [Anaerolineae bacterium]
MTTTTHLSQRQPAQIKASLYYGIMWGMMALSTTFISIDLNHRGVTETQWGIISALRALMTFLAAPIITRQADLRRTRVRWLRWIMILQAVVMLMFMIPRHFGAFLVLSLLSAVIGSAVMPLGDGVIVRMAQKHNLEFGRLRLWGSLGFAVFGTFGGWLWSEVGYSFIYIAGFLGYLVVAFFAGNLEEPAVHEAEIEIPVPEEEGLPLPKPKTIIQLLLGDTVLLLFLVAAFLRSSSELMFFSFSGIYIDALTGNAFYAGLINGGSAILEIPVMINAQRLIQRFGLAPLVVVGFFVQAAGLAVFALSSSPWLMYAGSTLRNMGFALYFVAAVQFIDRRAGKNDATSYQGLLSGISWGLAPLLATPLAGIVYQQWSAQWVFLLATLICTFSAVVMIPVAVLFRREEKQRAHQAETSRL